MKASEARQIALSKLDNIQYPQVIAEITTKSNKGELECWIYYEINSETRKKLIEDGFSVGETQFDRNEYLTKIEW